MKSVPRRMGSPSSSRSMSTVPLRRRKTLSAGSPSLKRTCPSAKCVGVIAVLSIGNRWRLREGKPACPHRLAWTPRTRAISTGFTTFAIQGIQPPLFKRCQMLRIWVLGLSPYADPVPLFFCRAGPYAALGHTSLDVSWIVLDAPAPGLSFCASSAAGAGNHSSRSGVRLRHAGLHNRSRNRARNWVHSRIWRSRDYFLSTPPTRKTAVVPFLRLRAHSVGFESGGFS
jgi:hypothetical protein